MADLPCHSVAITSMYTTKLECFDEIGTWGKHTFGNKFLKMLFPIFRRNNYLLTKLGGQIFRKNTVFHEHQKSVNLSFFKEILNC